jgi:hypothetical protein
MPSQAQLEASRRYQQRHRDEINKRSRERHAAKQAEMFPAKKQPRECNCRQWQTCMECRNTEKRRAWKAGEIPVYRLTVLQSIAGD